jgi:DUF1009 family protein
MSRIGLMAGAGELPIIFCEAAKKKGEAVIAFGLKGVTDERLVSKVEKMHWLEWGDFRKAVMLLAAERIKKITLLGKIKKELVLKGDASLDNSAREILDKIGHDKKDYSIFNGVAKALKALGVEIMDSTTYLGDLLPSKGVLTKRRPTDAELNDIEYGRGVARELASRDAGQAAAVKDSTVIALEGIEGTDEMIRRAGRLGGNGFTVVKVARPNQDMRFDVPVVGTETIKALVDAGGKVLALEEKRMFLLDKPGVVSLADSSAISVVII